MKKEWMAWAKTAKPLKAGGRTDPTAKFVLLMLCHHAGSKGVTWIGQRRLSEVTGLGPTAVYEALKRLEEQGFILRQYSRHQSGPRKGQRRNDTTTILYPESCPDIPLTQNEKTAIQFEKFFGSVGGDQPLAGW